MRTKVKALWKGMIPVRDVFVNVAIMKKEDLIVDVGKESFVIKYDDLLSPKIDRPVRDNFGGPDQKLLYYGVEKTTDNDEQLKML